MKGPPRGLVYVPNGIMTDIMWSDQECLLPQDKDQGCGNCALGSAVKRIVDEFLKTVHLGLDENRNNVAFFEINT